jgi:hypothetical protein
MIIRATAGIRGHILVIMILPLLGAQQSHDQDFGRAGGVGQSAVSKLTEL